LGGVSGMYGGKQACIQDVENCVLLGHYAASSGNFLPTFRDNLSVPSSWVKNPKAKRILDP
jgi:hypothetical protein